MIGERADALVLLGITGNLAKKKLFPALYNLARQNRLPALVVGVASSPWDNERLRHYALSALEAAGVEIDKKVFAELAQALRYVSGDYGEADTYTRLQHEIAKAAKPVCYFAIPPAMFPLVIRGISSVDTKRVARLVLEKPFGRDLASAMELNRLLHEYYPEESIFRIDHFLGKEPVENLLVFRFANSIFEPLWDRHHVDRVQINLAESFGVEGRGRFYDTVGATRDVVQNHLLQIVSLLAMEPPISDSTEALRDERAKALLAMRPLANTEIIRGQYEGYRNEDGVAPDSRTETFVAVRAEIESWRWAGVPWYIVAGKHLPTTVTEAVVRFKKTPTHLFASSNEAPVNYLRFEMKPGSQILLCVQAKRPGQEVISRPVVLKVTEDLEEPARRDAYERLLDDALNGDSRRFARQDSVEAAWRIVDPVLAADATPEPYARGTWGPASAAAFLS